MKKSLILGVISTMALLPMSMVSCKIFGVNVKELIYGGSRNTTPPNKDPNHLDPFNESSSGSDKDKDKNEDNKETNEVLTRWSYNGKTYSISREDTLDTLDAIYASSVLENDAKEFKEMLPKTEDYVRVKTLDGDGKDNEFPSIAKVSYYIRNLEHFKKGFPYKKKAKELEKISAIEYKKLIDTLIKIMEESKLESILSGKNPKDFSYEAIANKTLEDLEVNLDLGEPFWGKKIPEKITSHDWLTNEPNVIPEHYEEIGIINDHIVLKEEDPLDRKMKSTPSGLWIYNRMLTKESNWNYNGANEVNELFLSREFLSKKYDPEKYYLNLSNWFFSYWLKAKCFAMQEPLWKMLMTYLKLQQALIKNQEWNEEKTLSENFKELDLIEKLDAFHDAVLNYMKLDHLVGYTSDLEDDLFLFPTDNLNGNKTDFRDAYRWAYLQYHMFIQPLYAALSRDDKAAFEKAFEKAFENKKLKPYYEMIWANIKAVDKIDRPRKLTEQESLKAAKSIISHYKNNFNWKFKVEEPKENES